MEWLSLRMTVPVVLVLSATFLGADEVRRPSINPALIYWQAFASLEELNPGESRLLSESINHPSRFDAVEAAALLSTRERALKRYRKAAESDAECDWGLTYEDGPFLPLPHVLRMQIFCRLALLKAELLFAGHKTDEAMDWLLSVHRAARHCGSGDLIIPVLTQFQMEQSAMRACAAHVLDWDAASRREYLARWNSLPPLHTVKNAIAGELHFVGWLEDFWLQNDELKITPGIADALLSDEGGKTMTDEERAEAEKMAAQFTPDHIRMWIHEMRGFYLKIQAALDKPWLESNPELLALQSEYRNGDNLLMRLAAPMPLHKVNDLSFKTATIHTMLEAALEQGALLDENKIGAYKDSFSGSPLALRRAADGSLTITASPEPSKGAGGKIELEFPPPGRK